MGALSATRSSLAGLLLLLCTFALLTPTVAAYKLGDPVPMLKRAQYKGVSGDGCAAFDGCDIVTSDIGCAVSLVLTWFRCAAAVHASASSFEQNGARSLRLKRQSECRHTKVAGATRSSDQAL